MSEQPTPADLTAILADHWFHDGGDTCECGYWAEFDSVKRHHIEDALTAAGFGPVRAVEAERDRWQEKAQEFGAAYANANSRHHSELDRGNRLEAMCDRLAGRADDYLARAQQAEASEKALRESVEALAEWYAANGAQREAVGRPAWPSNVARDLRALLDSPADREDGAS